MLFDTRVVLERDASVSHRKDIFCTIYGVENRNFVKS
jgi:hypothetical protein